MNHAPSISIGSSSALWQSLQAQWQSSTITWLVLTVGVYLLAMQLYRRSRFYPLLIPVFTAVAVIVAVLFITDTPYADYRAGTQWLTLWIGPATVALGVPLYAQRQRVMALWRPILVALLVGCWVGLLSAIGIAWALGGSWQTLVSLAPKSATIPIALPMAERLGGLASLAAVAVAITGVVGAMGSAWLMRLLRIQSPAVHGFTLGLAAHAIGTARGMQIHPVAGAFAALAMGLNGVATALFMPWVLAWFGVGG
ncbi:MAG: LrgB family protein [Comamonas sp.]|nr:LrgB family protein [Comamonas sp.]